LAGRGIKICSLSYESASISWLLVAAELLLGLDEAAAVRAVVIDVLGLSEAAWDKTTETAEWWAEGASDTAASGAEQVGEETWLSLGGAHARAAASWAIDHDRSGLGSHFWVK